MPYGPKRVLVAIDFSPSSHRALEHGIHLARRNDARLDLVHALGQVTAADASPEPTAAAALAARPDRKRSREQLESWGEKARSSGLETHLHLVEEEPAQAILDKAEQVRADHIVMGAHAKGATASFLLGSVSREVRNRAGCPVTTVRPLPRELRERRG